LEGFSVEVDMQALIKGLEGLGIRHANRIFWNLTSSALYEEVIRRAEELIAHLGPLVARTGHHTGRSPNGKFIVKDDATKNLGYTAKLAGTEKGVGSQLEVAFSPCFGAPFLPLLRSICKHA